MPVLRTISVADAWAEVQAGRGSLIDVREPGEFESVRAPRAVNFPLSSFEERVSELAPGAAVYVLCAVGPRAIAAAKILSDSSRTGIVVEGGMTEWRRRGLPVEKGERSVWPMDRQVRFVAGALVLTGTVLGSWVHPRFYALAGLIGAGLFISGFTGFCGMAHVLARCPWNRASRVSEK